MVEWANGRPRQLHLNRISRSDRRSAVSLACQARTACPTPDREPTARAKHDARGPLAVGRVSRGLCTWTTWPNV